MKHRSRRIWTCCLLLLLLLTTMEGGAGLALADSFTRTETYVLNEAKVKQQFIIEGTNDAFEVDMLLPDGKEVRHDDEPGGGFLYIGAENRKTWIVADAQPGTYTFRITSEAEQSFRVSTKDAVRKPETAWLSPLDQQITVTAVGQDIPAAWNTEGDARPGQDRLSMKLRPVGGWNEVLVQEAFLADGQAAFRVPESFSDGEYDLLITADNRSSIPQEINPHVVIKVERMMDGPKLELVRSVPSEGGLQLDVRLPKGQLPEHLTARLIREDRPDEPLIVTGTRDALETVPSASSASSEEQHYRWHVGPLAGEGRYTGAFYAYTGNRFSKVIPLPSFELKERDWSGDQVLWSIDEDVTNRGDIQVRLLLQEDSQIEVLDQGTVLYEGPVGKAENAKPHTLELPLSEGEHLFDVRVTDAYGNAKIYSKRLFADRTPPLLEIIQPLASHSKTPGGFASGYVEPGSSLKVNGKELAAEADGYFKIDGIGNTLRITLEDAAGNLSEYVWKAQGRAAGWLWIVGINAAIILSAVGTIVFLRRKKT